MTNGKLAKQEVIETLSSNPFWFCEDEVTDALRYADLLRLYAVIKDHENARDVIFNAIELRVYELIANRAEELDQQESEAERKEAHDRWFYSIYGGVL